MHLMLEVMDKAPSLRVIWGGAAALGLIGYAAVRFRRWLVLPALALIAIVAWTQLGDSPRPARQRGHHAGSRVVVRWASGRSSGLGRDLVRAGAGSETCGLTRAWLRVPYGWFRFDEGGVAVGLRGVTP